jgi:ATP-dependent DNA helicase DinG
LEIIQEIKNFFSPCGVLGTKFENYEYRSSQLEMALQIFNTLEKKSHIFIEAPTGIGKSFAYLVPAIYYAKANKKKAVISTNTINLQEQLINKDLPFIQQHLPLKFKATLIKGKQNYLCPKRLKKALETSNNLFESDESMFLQRVNIWSKETSDGTISELPFPLNPMVWSSICAERGICNHKTCGSIEETECFYQKAKYALIDSDVVVINHHLFFSLFNYEFNSNSDGYLFKNDFIIFDEAQTIENVAAEHIVPSLTREMIKYQLMRLYNEKKKKGFLLSFPALHILPVVMNLMDLINIFFQTLKRELFPCIDGKFQNLTIRIFNKNITKNILKEELSNLTGNLRGLTEFCKDELEKNELEDFILKFSEFNYLIDNFIEQKYKNTDSTKFVYWIELSSLREDANISLCASPVNLSEYFRQNIFKINNSCILTSATLTVNNNFNFYKSRLGGESADELQLPSMFDYYKQVKIYIPRDIPEPQKYNSEEYINKLCNWIQYFIKYTEGKALVLFTNSMLMRKVKSELSNFFDDNNIRLLVQGENMSRKKILNIFKSDINSVLFGLDSFWLGVDVPGEALSNLIITRLPFFVPEHPLIQARLEYIDETGGNSFMNYLLPEAILKFKQGFGRLIRNKEDKGIIVILDNRIITKNYGKYFFNSINECEIEII